MAGRTTRIYHQTELVSSPATDIVALRLRLWRGLGGEEASNSCVPTDSPRIPVTQ